MRRFGSVKCSYVVATSCNALLFIDLECCYTLCAMHLAAGRDSLSPALSNEYLSSFLFRFTFYLIENWWNQFLIEHRFYINFWLRTHRHCAFAIKSNVRFKCLRILCWTCACPRAPAHMPYIYMHTQFGANEMRHERCQYVVVVKNQSCVRIPPASTLHTAPKRLQLSTGRLSTGDNGRCVYILWPLSFGVFFNSLCIFICESCVCAIYFCSDIIESPSEWPSSHLSICIPNIMSPIVSISYLLVLHLVLVTGNLWPEWNIWTDFSW